MSSNLEVHIKKSLSARLSQKAFDLENRKRKNNESHGFDKMCQAKTNFINNIDISTMQNGLVNKNAKQSTLRLGFNFFNCPCITVAKCLLGKILARRLNSGEILKGRIVETECYLGSEDKASHSYQGRKTERNEAMFLQPGTAYVYTIYGMYYCFNISTVEEGSAVLIRALEPLQNTPTMLSFRSVKRKSSSVLKEKDICNGPSKLCQAFKIEKNSLNKVDLCTSDDLWLENDKEIPECDIIACKRIGIDSAGEEWANKPLRFYVKNCPWVSVRNKLAEQNRVT